MTTSDVIVNAGGFFVSDAEAKLAASDLYSDATIEEMFGHLTEHFERHRSHLKDDATAAQVGFFLVNRALHILGYTHSHNEPLGEDTRIEYTLFSSAEAFTSHVAGRGTNAFFSGAVGIGKLAAWAADLDDAQVKEGEEGPAESLSYELDELLRVTNLQWAILTNGRKWRLYHRNTVAMQNAYFEMDLLHILEEQDTSLFKIFAAAFGAKAIDAERSGSCQNKRLLG